MHAPPIARNDVDFTGVLAQVRRTEDKDYQFLMFRTAQGVRICLSRNAESIGSMRIGTTYRVRGRETTIGHTTYLDIYSIGIWLPRSEPLKKRSGLFAVGASMIVIVGLAGTGLFGHKAVQINNQTGAPAVRTESGQDASPPGTKAKVKSIIGEKPVTESNVRVSPSSSDQAADDPIRTPEPSPQQVAVPSPSPEPASPPLRPEPPAATPEPEPPVPPIIPTTDDPSIAPENVEGNQ